MTPAKAGLALCRAPPPPLPDDLEGPPLPAGPAAHPPSRPRGCCDRESATLGTGRGLRVLLAEEAAGRERSALANRRVAAPFPTGKTFESWPPDASSIPAPNQRRLRTLEWGQRP